MGRRRKASNRIALTLAVLSFVLLDALVILSTSSRAYGANTSSFAVNFDTFPRRTSLIVDGVTYLPQQQPVTFNWLNGTVHTFGVTRDVTNFDSGKRYKFEKWNDGFNTGGIRTITASADQSYIAIFRTQYYVVVETEYGTPEGEGWYDEGSTVPIRVEPTFDIIPGQSRMVFISWSQGLKPKANENLVTVFSPSTITASWKKQYSLEVASEVKGAVAAGSGWYDEGSEASILTSSEYILRAGEHKYLFNGWVSAGDNPPNLERQDAPNTVVKVDNYYSIRAAWTEMWRLTVLSDPSDLISRGENEWYKAGSTVTLERAPDKKTGYKFQGWWIDGTPVSSNPPTVEMDQSHVVEARFSKYYTVIMDTYPRVSPITVDKRIFLPSSLPLTFEWTQDSEHTFGLPADAVPGSVGTRYIFTGWNDLEKNTSRRVTVRSDTAYTALLKTQYYFSITSEYGSPIGEGWYDANTVATFKVEPLAGVTANQSRHRFAGWEKGQTRWSPNNSIEISGPTSVAAQWITQYWLNVSTPVIGTTAKGSGWYDDGSKVKIYTTPLYEPEYNSHKFTFKQWSSSQQSAIIENSQKEATIVLVDSYYDINAEWNEWYYLGVESLYGEPKGSGYYLKGDEAIASVTSPFETQPFQSRLAFVKWVGDLETNENKVSLIMDRAKSLTAEWRKQNYLKIVSASSNVQGTGWYDEGRQAKIFAEKSISAGIGRWTEFENWSGDLLSSQNEADLLMDSPHTVYANWSTNSTQFTLLLISMIGSGLVVTLILVRSKFNPKKWRKITYDEIL